MIKYQRTSPLAFNDTIEKLYPEIIGDKKISQITFQITEDCCLKCTYCYQNHKTKNVMNFQTAKIFIDKLLTDQYEYINSKNTVALYIEFIGGEPLMQIELIDQIWTYLLTRLIQLDHPWQYFIRGNIGTNGILYFQPKVQEFLKKYHNWFSFGISIDGNKELHDSCRIDLNNQGTYDRAVAAALHYKKTYGELPTIKMTLSPDNIHYTYNAVINLINLGYVDINLNCVYEKGWTDYHAKILYKEMLKISDYILENNLCEKIYISLFDENMFSPLPIEENNNWCGGAGDTMLAIDYKGDLFTCIRFMESSLNGKCEPLKIGNVLTGFFTTIQEKEAMQKLTEPTRLSQSTEECINCPVAAGCAWCSGYNYEETGSVNKRVTYICKMHKARALANVYYWNKVYKKYNLNKEFKNYLNTDEIEKIIKEE